MSTNKTSNGKKLQKDKTSNGKKRIIIVKSVTKFNLLVSLMKIRVLFGDRSSEKTGSLKTRKGRPAR